MKLKHDWLRLLDPINEGRRIYRFLTKKIVKQKLYGSMATHPDCVLKTKDGKAWASIKKGFIYIAVGYAWNGSSPKYYAGWPPLGKWLGTPDTNENILASLIHDVLYKFAKVGTYSFDEANYQFLKIMQQEKFALAGIYYAAVQEFGKKFWEEASEDVIIEYVYEKSA